MSPERWQRVESVFQMALERQPEERDAFLKTACAGDLDLQNEVSRMLASDLDAQGFLETPAAELTARRLAEESQSLAPGTMIGPYRIEGPIGSGGMGDVYKARDTRLARTVAIKVLDARAIPGQQGRERFLREAQAASALNHPHIVTLCRLRDYADKRHSPLRMGRSVHDDHRHNHRVARKAKSLSVGW
jgi:hypothetical protein